MVIRNVDDARWGSTSFDACCDHWRSLRRRHAVTVGGLNEEKSKAASDTHGTEQSSIVGHGNQHREVMETQAHRQRKNCCRCP